MSFLAEISLRKSRGQTRESIIAMFEADLQLEFPETNIEEVVVEEAVEAAVEEPQVVAERNARKPRVVPEDEHRCHARTRYEEKHYEGGRGPSGKLGRVKVMRDDPANLYWGRCESKKLAEGCFCKKHREKQKCGVWNGIYGDWLERDLRKDAANSK
jgi:hypothetical protein